MANFIIAAIVILIVGGALAYIIKEKKRGAKCIGCSCGCSNNSESSECCSGCRTETN